jgi:hypothetical protein
MNKTAKLCFLACLATAEQNIFFSFPGRVQGKQVYFSVCACCLYARRQIPPF